MAGRLLVCTDLDGTLIADGLATESTGARPRFDALVSRPEVALAYVSGRHLELVQQAISEFDLPAPDFIIADVGTSIYRSGAGGGWKNQQSWQAEIGRDWRHRKADTLHQYLREVSGLELQEASKQGAYKLSYYFPADIDPDALRAQTHKLLAARGIRSRAICSFDAIRDIGLLDIVPERASKLHAIEALVRESSISAEDIVFSGDSGNDLEVLASHIPSVLVANASKDIKARALKLAQAAGNTTALHIAAGGFLGMNGCYSAGILEGIAHFHPRTREWMVAAEPALAGSATP